MTERMGHRPMPPETKNEKTVQLSSAEQQILREADHAAARSGREVGRAVLNALLADLQRKEAEERMAAARELVARVKIEPRVRPTARIYYEQPQPSSKISSEGDNDLSGDRLRDKVQKLRQG